MSFININPQEDSSYLFVNSVKSDTQPIEQYHLSQYNYNQLNNNNQSISLTVLFNHNSHKYPLDNNLSSLYEKHQQQPQISIGFNNNNKHLQNFFQHSLNFTNQQNHFKNASIKKTSTFTSTQWFLNQTISSSLSTQIKQQHHHDDNPNHLHQKKSIKNINKQNIKNCGTHYYQNQNINKIQHQYHIQHHGQQQHQHQDQNQQIPNKQNVQITVQKSSEHQSFGQNSLQNLRAIAKLAFESIKKQKLATYQSISNIMLSLFNQQQQNISQNSNIQNNNNNPRLLLQQQRKNKLIQNMIKSKSFKGVQLMAEIQQQQQLSYDSASRKHVQELTKRHPIQKQSKNHQIAKPTQKIKNLKNIRRRLYDAINVMLAAKIIQKRQNGYLAIRSQSLINNRRGRRTVLSQHPTKIQDNWSIEQLQKRVYEKRKQLQAKRKYKDLLITKYLTLQKHVNRNKLLSKRASYSDQKKLHFPIIFASTQLPMKINFTQNAQLIEIQSQQRFDIHCDLDVLGLLYWIEKEQIINKVQQINKHNNNENNRKKRSQPSEGNENDDQEQKNNNINLRKKIKLEQQSI